MKKEDFTMKENSFAAEMLNDKENNFNYYEGKRFSAFSMIFAGGSFLINALIVGYAIVTAIIS